MSLTINIFVGVVYGKININQGKMNWSKQGTLGNSMTHFSGEFLELIYLQVAGVS